MKSTPALTPSPRPAPYATAGSADALAPSRRSSHVSRACATCQRRKTKCDGVEPACGTCAVHGTECEYSAEPDRRKTRDAHAAIASLRDEIENLKKQLHGQNEELEKKMRALLVANDQEYPLLSCTMRAVSSDTTEDGADDFSLVIRAKKSSVCLE
ncbi:hypothetical protein AURDEDRAFT_137405 [Auricularia subglabra TFB-10046 SS5]|nr:hypothetical protein AURDEDRAFT_137405 [Auricularia subglabra TFB-10046 SS5]